MSEGTDATEEAAPAVRFESEGVSSTGAADAAALVMLGLLVLLLLSLFALILRLRYLARHPRRELADLETLGGESGDDA